MKPSQNRHLGASALHCSKTDATTRLARQDQYRQKLARLSQTEGQDYLRIYDALSQEKAITPLVECLMDREVISNRVYKVAIEIAAVVKQLSEACQQQNAETHHQLHEVLDDLNIAVNAWKNRICLKHSAFLYRQYRQLREQAREPQLN